MSNKEKVRRMRKYKTLFENTPVAISHQDFTDAKKHLDELLASENCSFLEYLSERPEALQEISSRTRIMDVNPAAVKLFKARDKKELIDNYALIFHEDTIESYIQFLDKVLFRNCSSDSGIDVAARTLAGEDIMINLSWSKFDGTEEGTVELWTFAIDITKQKKTEDELQKEIILSAEYINSLPGLFYVFDDSKFIRWNSPWFERTGYSDEELAKMYGPDFFEGKDKELITERMTKVFVEGSAVAEAMLITKSGRKIPYYFTGVRKRVGDKDLLVGLGIDISEIKKAVEEIKNLLEFNSAIIEQSPVGISIFDKDGNCIRVNAAMANDVGGTVEQLLKMNYHNIRTWKETGFYDALQKSIKNNTPTRYEMEGTSTYGKYMYFDCFIMPLESGDVLIMMNNISIRKKAEIELRKHREELEVLVKARTDELEKTTEQLVHSQKMEGIGQLAGGMAHEFNNILATITGTAEILVRTTPPGSKQHENALRILKSSKRGIDITSKLLTFARKERLNVVTVPINSVVEEIIDVLKGTISKKIETITNLTERANHVTIDMNQVTQALLNLCLNACDAMPDGGTLFIETKILEDEEKQEYPQFSAANLCEISISDTGSGIDEISRDKIFNPFFTTKKRGKGTGLGLSVSHGIIEAHSGILKLAGTGPGGTTFKIILPIETGVRPFIKQDADATAPAKNGRIMVIDDDVDFLQMAEELLKLDGYGVTAFQSGKEAIQHYEENMDNIDLVLLDMIMPEIDGSEVFYRLKNIDSSAKIVLCSGYSVEGIATKLMEDGAGAYVQKPFDAANLRSTLSDILSN